MPRSGPIRILRFLIRLRCGFGNDDSTETICYNEER